MTVVAVVGSLVYLYSVFCTLYFLNMFCIYSDKGTDHCIYFEHYYSIYSEKEGHY